MLLALLTIIAVLIGGWTFAAMISSWGGDLRKSAQPPVFPNRQVSLWSLILFLFFPTVSAPSSSKHLARIGDTRQRRQKQVQMRSHSGRSKLRTSASLYPITEGR